MFDSHTHVEKDSLAAVSVLGSICLLLGVSEPVAAQDRERTSPSVHSTPSQHGAGAMGQRGGDNRSVSRAPGTGLPSATRPSDPPSSLGQPPSGATPAGIRARTNDSPNMPGGPPQAPIGGAEWLAAAGAAYALNRLREKKGKEEESENDA